MTKEKSALKNRGPGKIDELGSISAAARALGITHKHASQIVDELNGIFVSTLVERTIGGTRGGGSRLTSKGKFVAARLKQIENDAAARALGKFDELMSDMERPAKKCRIRPRTGKKWTI